MACTTSTSMRTMSGLASTTWTPGSTCLHSKKARSPLPHTFDVGLYVDIELDSRDNPLFAYMDNNRKYPLWRSSPKQPYPDAGPGLPDHRKHRSLHQLGSRQCEPCAHGIHNSGINADVRYTSMDNMAFSEKVDTRAGYHTSLALRDDGALHELLRQRPARPRLQLPRVAQLDHVESFTKATWVPTLRSSPATPTSQHVR